MIFHPKKLQARDLHTLTEAESPEDGSRPLEWRRSFNNIRFDASTFLVDSIHRINASDGLVGVLWKEDQDRNNFPIAIEEKVSREIRINSKVSFEGIDDSFYQTFELDKNEKIFTVSGDSRAETLVLTLLEGEPKSEDWHCFKAGSYYGNAMYIKEDRTLYVEVTANKEVVFDLVQAINSNILDKVTFNVAVSSFSYEVDDFLREWDDKRDLLIHGISTPAALTSVVIHNKAYTTTADPCSANDSKIQEDTPKEETVPARNSNLDASKRHEALFDASLKSIKFALWALVFIGFLALLK